MSNRDMAESIGQYAGEMVGLGAALGARLGEEIYGRPQPLPDNGESKAAAEKHLHPMTIYGADEGGEKSRSKSGNSEKALHEAEEIGAKTGAYVGKSK